MNIKDYIHNNYVAQWKVAQHLGINEGTLCRWLRDDLSPEREQMIRRAVDEIVFARTQRER